MRNLRKINMDRIKSGDLITLNPGTRRNPRWGRQVPIWDSSNIETFHKKDDPTKMPETYAFNRIEIGIINVGDVALVLDKKSHEREYRGLPETYWEVKIMLRSGEGTLVGWVSSEIWAKVGN